MIELSLNIKWLTMIVEGAKLKGVDLAPLLLSRNISVLSLNDSNSRISITVFADIVAEAIAIMDDEFVGLGQYRQPFGSFAMMSQAAISSKTILASLKQCARFWNLFNNGYIHSVNYDDDIVEYSLQRQAGFNPPNEYLASALLSSIHRFHCWSGSQFIKLEEVLLDHSGLQLDSEYEGLYYGSKLVFDQPKCSFRFGSKYANVAVSQTPDTLHEYLKVTNLSLIFQPKNYRIVSDQVRQWLYKNISNGNYTATLKEAARHLGVSQQVLHRRLNTENISFKDIKMETRRDLAIKLLSENQTSIEDIASTVGFSEPSAFIRAFKSWTGTTPKVYRKKSSSLCNNP